VGGWRKMPGPGPKISQLRRTHTYARIGGEKGGEKGGQTQKKKESLEGQGQKCHKHVAYCCGHSTPPEKPMVFPSLYPESGQNEFHLNGLSRENRLPLSVHV